AQAVNPFSKGKPSGTQGFELYCIPELQEKGNSEILVNNNEDLEEKGIELNPEVVLDKLLTICLEALKWLPGFENLKPE
ncbi:12329_t:CDS:1, partial [Gigaspora rosea]